MGVGSPLSGTTVRSGSSTLCARMEQSAAGSAAKRSASTSGWTPPGRPTGAASRFLRTDRCSSLALTAAVARGSSMCGAGWRPSRHRRGRHAATGSFSTGSSLGPFSVRPMSIRPDGSAARDEEPKTVDERLGAWPPDGKRRARLMPEGIEIVNANGSNPHLLVPRDDTPALPPLRWSPDGTMLAFVRAGPIDAFFPDTRVVRRHSNRRTAPRHRPGFQPERTRMAPRRARRVRPLRTAKLAPTRLASELRSAPNLDPVSSRSKPLRSNAAYSNSRSASSVLSSPKTPTTCTC